MASKKKKKFSEQVLQGEYKSSLSRESVAPALKKTNASVTKAYAQPEEKKWYQEFLKTSKTFSDGYDVGDVSKAILGTATDIENKLGKGFLSIFEAPVDIGTYATSTVLDVFGADKQAEKVKKFGQRNLSEELADKYTKEASILATGYNTVSKTQDDYKKVVELYKSGNIEEGREATKKMLKDAGTGLLGLVTGGSVEQLSSRAGLSPEKLGIALDKEKLIEDIDNDSVSGDTLDQVAELVGYMTGMGVATSGLNAVTGTAKIGSATTGASVSGGNVGITVAGKTLNLPTVAFMGGASGGLNEAYQKEDVTHAQAWTKGLSSGMIESVTEGMFGVLGVGGNELTDQMATKLAKKFSSSFGKQISNMAVKGGGEAFEELASYTLNWLTDNNVIDKMEGADFSSEFDWEEASEQMALALISGGVTQGSNTALHVNAEANNIINQIEQEVGRPLTREERRAIRSETAQKVIELQNDESLQQGLTEEAPVGENVQVQTDEETRENLVRQLKETKETKGVTTEDVAIQDIAPVGENVVQQAGQQDITPGVEQTGQQVNEADLKRRNYTYVASETDSQLTRELKESASRVMNDTKRSHEFVETVSKIAERTQTKYRFTNTEELNALGYGVEGRRVNGLVTKNGEILINIDSQKALNTIIGHETTHLLEGTKEYKALQDAVFKYAQTKGDFVRESDRMSRIYAGQKNVNIDNELTSELVGDYLFTDQQFLNDLASEQPSIVRKIYNEIKHWIKMATAGSKEARQLEDLKYRFEKALSSKPEKMAAVNETKQTTTQETKDKSVVEVESNTQEKAESVQEIEDTTKAEKRSLSEDNNGRKLSEEQIEFFEDSVVRDEEGRLLTLYHGTRADFNVFESDRAGQNYEDNWSRAGRGHYFTPDIKYAKDYGEASVEKGPVKIKEVYLNITNPFDMATDYSETLTDMKNEYNIDEFYLKAGYRLIDWFRDAKIDSTEVLKKYGFDGIHDFDDYIAFESNQIKEATNKNPTEDSDIRYSLSEKDSISLMDKELDKQREGLALDKISEPVNIGTIKTPKGKELSLESQEINLSSPYVGDRYVRKITATDIEGNKAILSFYTKKQDLVIKHIEGAVRGDGSGTTLLNQIIEEAKENGITRIIADDTRHNLDGRPSRTYWEKQGFVSNGEGDHILNLTESDDIRYSLSESTTDNQGRKLTKEQQEHFKDSKVRDAEGRLVEVYHGTPYGGFTIFDNNHESNVGMNLLGEGFYFTSLESMADEYSRVYDEFDGSLDYAKDSKVYKAYLNIKNPFIYNASEEYIKKAVEKIGIKFDKVTLKTDLINKGYDGIIEHTNYSDFTQIVAFYPSQIKNVDNTNPTESDDIRYSLSENPDEIREALVSSRDTLEDRQLRSLRKYIAEQRPNFFSKKTDNLGRKLSPGMQDYMEDSKARDVNDSLSTVYHTMTDRGPQFNEFNPVGTDYYRFGNQVVNYYTDSKVMSGSYANQDYKMADTKKFNSRQELDAYLEKLNKETEDLYSVKQRDDGKFIVSQDKQISREARYFINSLNRNEKQQMLDNIFEDEKMKGSHYDRVFSWNYFDKALQDKYHEVINKYMGTADLVAIQQEMMKYLESPIFLQEDSRLNGEVVSLYDTESDMLRNIKTDIQKSNWSKDVKYQYEGYVNITNPYVVDAEGRSWGRAEIKFNDNKQDDLNKITSDSDKVEQLKKLMYQSRTRHSEYDFSGDEWTYYHYKNTADAIKGRELNDAVQMCAMFGFEYNEYAESHKTLPSELVNGNNTLPSGDTTVTDLTTELTETNYNMFKDMTLSDFVRVYAQEYEKNMLYGKEDSYFKHEYKNITGELKELPASDLFKIATKGFTEDSITDAIAEESSTNDIVHKVIDMNKNGSNYDGVIIKNVVDYGGKANGEYYPANLYVTFNSNQFKAWDNENPTDDPDMRYSLSELDEDIAPVGNYNVYGSEVGLQRQVEEAIAPLQEKVEELTKVITDLQENIAPATFETAEEQRAETQRTLGEGEAPLTEEGTFNFLDEVPIEIKNKRDITYDIQNVFNIKHTEAREIYNKIANMPELSVEDIYAELEKHKQVKVQEQDDYYKDIQNYIKGTKLDISEIKKQITDYDNVYRMANMGKGLTLANSGQSIDSFYQELNELYPNVFPSTVTAEADQLDLISQVMFRDTNLTYTETLDDDTLQILAEKLYSEIGNRERYKSAEAHVTNWFRHYKDMLAPGEEAPIKTDISYEDYVKSLDKLPDDYAPYLEQAIEINASNTEQTVENVSITNELNRLDTQMKQSEEQNEPTIVKNPFDEILDNFLARARRERTQTPVQRVEKSKLRNAVDTGKRLLVNEMAETDNLAHETGNLNIKFKGDMLNSVAGEIEGEIYTAQTDNYGREIGTSLSNLFRDAKDEGMYEEFNHYLELYSNIDRHKQGKGSKVSLAESEQLVKAYDQQSSLYRTWAKDVWQYGENILDNLVDAGLIDKAYRNRLREMYPHYVPYVENRDVNNYYPDLGEIKSTSVIKRAKGGASNLLPIEEALTKYTFASKKAVRQNQFYQEIVSTLEDKVSIGADVRGNATDLETSLYRDETGNYLTAYFNGQQQSVRISDDLYTGLKNDLKHQIEGLEQKFAIVTDPVQKISEIRRNLLTSWNPMFIIRNPLMDIQDAVFNSKYTKDFVKHYNIKTFMELGKANTETARQFLTLYGSGNVMGEFSSDGSVKNAKHLKWIQRANNIMELAPRFAEFKASLDNGASIQEAMYNAREVTTNFSRGGTITKALNKNGFTFLNVSVQGFDKFIRNFSGENGAKGVVGSLLKATTLGVLPALFNELAFGGDDDEKDEDYDALPDYIKDNYYLIKTGDGEFIRIPKGRILSVFGSAARRTLEYLQGEEDAFEGFLKNANSQIGVSNPLDSNILTPLFQAFGSENGEAWYGGDIVPKRLQDKAPEEQYDASTDKFSIWLGDKIGVSPYKINYVLDQYSGGIGDIFLPMITDEATNDAEGPGVILAPIKDAFTSNSTFDNKYAGDIYDLSDKMDKLPTATKETDEYKIQDSYLYSVTSEMAELYAERREVQANKNLSKKEKYAKVQEIQKQINSLAKEGLDNYQNVNKTDNYAIVGGREFNKYTTDSGEERWGAVFSDVLDDMNSMGMDIEEKSEYFKATSTISSIQSNYEDSSDYVSKKRDVISIIKDTNLNDEQKAYLYDKYYGNSDVVNAMVTLDVDIDSYLDYESQNFEADKDSSGKSISGSKKRKVFDYINSMPIDFEQRVILAKLQYPSYDEYNAEIVEYLNSSDMTYEQEIVFLEKLGFKVDEEGYIYW